MGEIATPLPPSRMLEQRPLSTAGQPSVPDKLVSDLLVDDPEMLDIVEEFIEGLETRLDEFRQAFEQLDWDHLAKLAHQLKGAGGSYGYAELSNLAREMEAGFRACSADRFVEWMAHFERLIAAARAGLYAV